MQKQLLWDASSMHLQNIAGPSIKYVRAIYLKSSIFYSLICTRPLPWYALYEWPLTVCSAKSFLWKGIKQKKSTFALVIDNYCSLKTLWIFRIYSLMPESLRKYQTHILQESHEIYRIWCNTMELIWLKTNHCKESICTLRRTDSNNARHPTT